VSDAPYGTAAAGRAAAVLRARVGDAPPALAIILGSGLGGLVDRLTDAVRVPYAEVPGFVAPTVAGHAGVVVTGEHAGRRVLCFAGRFHMYEGHEAAHAAFPVRVAHALGANTLLVTNAAGGIRRTFTPGTLMVIADHVNLQFRNPLIGPVEPGDARFPDLSAPYDPALQAALRAAGRAAGVPLETGVYAGLLGPSYETPAEVRMLERLGVDAVGMSTVPEVLVARARGVRVAGVSLITNAAAGYAAPLSHDEVMAEAAAAAGRLEAVVGGFMERLSS
jgi:purine-nucleoside phosphorylase